jgi:MFS family permease
MDRMLLDFAKWLESQSWSSDLHGSFYMYNWIESTHVMTLMVSLGLLAVIDLRMLGLCLTNVPASKLADRLGKPMLFGFALMFVTGSLLFAAIPVRTTQSLWFRIKVVLLIAAAINAFLFHRHLNASKHTWESTNTPPRRLRVAAGLSLALWIGVVTTGRFIAYDWFDCGQKTNSEFINWAAGCVAA